MAGKPLRTRNVILVTVLAVSVLVMLNIFAQIDNWRRDWTTNTAELAPTATDPDLRPLELPQDVAQVREKLEQWVTAQSNWSLESAAAGNPDGEPASTAVHLTRTTRWMRFTDDIHVELAPGNEGGTRVTAKSQSRIGKGDLGQNPRNLKELVRALRE